MDFLFPVLALGSLQLDLFPCVFAKIDLVFLELDLPFPTSLYCFVVTLLHLELLVKFVKLCLQYGTLIINALHLFRCHIPVLLHDLFHSANLTHMTIDFSLLSCQLPFQFINWEISALAAGSAQRPDLFLDLWHVDCLLDLLVCLALNLDGSNGVRHDHVEV